MYAFTPTHVHTYTHMTSEYVVYFIGSDPCIGRIVIGVTDNLNTRLASLQADSQTKLKVIVRMKMNSEDEAYQYKQAIESEISKHIKHTSDTAECDTDEFTINEEKAEDIADLVRSNHAC